MHRSSAVLHVPPIRILSGGAYRTSAGRHTPLHRHPVWELVYYRSGRPRYQVDAAISPAGPGVLWLTPPGHAHAEFADTAFANWFLAIDAPADQPWPQRCRDDGAGSCERLCSAIVRELHEPGGDGLLAALATELDLRLRRAARTPVPVARDLVAEALALIEADGGEVPHLGRLAARLGVAPSTLRLAWRRQRGAPPSAALRAARARRALDLLRRSDLSQAAVAAMCGYDSASHLSRTLRRLHGQTPGRLRRS